MFLWKWAADDVALPYPITWYLANLCMKLVLVQLEPGKLTKVYYFLTAECLLDLG